MVVELPDGTKVETTADNDGNWTANVPAGKEPKENDVVKAVATVDGKTPSEEATAKTTAATPAEQTAKPTITAPKAGDKTITGTSEPNAKVVVELPDGTKVETTADKDGNWTAKVPEGKEPKKGQTVKATATVDGKTPSEEATATVKGKTSHGGSSGGATTTPSNPEPDDLNKEDHYQYLIGYPDGTFAPNRGMTRAEVATMFTRLLKDRPVKGKAYKVALSDVHAGDWYANTVGYALEKGIVSGYPDGSFKPNQAITRAEFASIASRFADLTESKDLSFSDLDASYWGYKAIRLAASNGWISGYPDNTFRPEQAITRAEVTSITNRMLNRSADLDWINAHNAKVIHFSDVSAGDWFFEPVMEATMGHDFTRDKDGKTEHWNDLNDKTFI